MKPPKHLSTLHYFVQRALFFGALLMVWALCFPHVLRNMEEIAFWSDAPDMASVMYIWPADWAPLAAHFLAQFLAERWLGAALQALMALLVVLSFDAVLWRCFRRRRVLCLSFVPAAGMVLLCLRQPMLTLTIQCVAASLVLALLALIVTLLPPAARLFPLTKGVAASRRWRDLLAAGMPYFVIIAMCIGAATDSRQRSREHTAQVEHLAEDGRWDELIALTYPERQTLDANLMAYSLLAQNQEGKLADKLFHYPVKGIESIFQHETNYRFNSFFCHALHLPNEAVRYAFEEGQYMPAGTSFGSLRRMVDWIIEKGDDPKLADFYINLLEHSSCHTDFTLSRRIALSQQTTNQPLPAVAASQAASSGAQPAVAANQIPEPEFVGSPSFLYEAALILEREPTNIQARDLLLCGLLLLGQTEAFFDVFERTYVETNDAAVPAHYIEALLLLKQSHPTIDSSYNIPIQTEAAYRDFSAIAAQGPRGREQAIAKYPNTLWAYLARLGNKAASGPETEIKLSGKSHFN